MTVVDASALLAFTLDEKGADLVEDVLLAGGVVGAANWSEVGQKMRQHGNDWIAARALLLSYELGVESVTQADAEWAADRWREGEGLSLADRLCLALAVRLDTEVLTADSDWGREGRIRQIR